MRTLQSKTLSITKKSNTCKSWGFIESVPLSSSISGDFKDVDVKVLGHLVRRRIRGRRQPTDAADAAVLVRPDREQRVCYTPECSAMKFRIQTNIEILKILIHRNLPNNPTWCFHLPESHSDSWGSRKDADETRTASRCRCRNPWP